MEKIKFAGDWAELADVFGIEMGEDDDILAKDIKDYIWSKYNLDTRKLDEQTKEILYLFLDSLLESAHTFDTPMFKALKEIEDDWVFIQWFSHNLTLLWT